MRSLLLAITTLFALSACAGSGGSGPGSAGAGPAGGGALDSPGQGAGASLPADQPVLGQAEGDGTLGSQSSSVDLEPTFYRTHALFFAGEPLAQGTGYDYILPSVPGNLPAAQVLKIFKDLQGYKEVPCLACEGRYVRAVNCGKHSDADILQNMPPEEHNNPTASNPLFWYLVHMPRAVGGSSVTVCEGATYRDFPVKNSGVVDLEALDLYPQEIVVFYLLPENPPAEVGPLSIDGFMQIAKEGIAATAQQGLIRYTRPVGPLKLSPQTFEILKIQ
ncbi:MAG: hypothetical protein IT572_01955 [Deltaproteobacteria bacterium]|nr:hypothetical protein [Deltaproteobacteria bacterium]